MSADATIDMVTNGIALAALPFPLSAPAVGGMKYAAAIVNVRFFFAINSIQIYNFKNVNAKSTSLTGPNQRQCSGKRAYDCTQNPEHQNGPGINFSCISIYFLNFAAQQSDPSKQFESSLTDCGTRIHSSEGQL